MKINIEINDSEALELIEMFSSVQVDVAILTQKLEEIQCVIESYQAEGPDGFATAYQDEGCGR
jgi:regulator of RNase E activity RraB